MITESKQASRRPSPDEMEETEAPPARRGPSLVGIGLTLLICAALAAAIYYNIHARAAAETSLAKATQKSEIPLVNVVYPTSGSAASEISLPGNTQAFTDTPIYARTSGYLKAWYADIGARVKKGQLLAQIETPELDQQLQQAQAELKDAQANLQIAQTTSGRYQALLKTNSVSRQEADQTASDLSSRQALVDSSMANVRRLQQMQDFEKIYAPFDGVVTARNTDIGDLIQAGNSSSARELFHMAAINELRVYIPVPEVYAADIKSGEKVKLTLDVYPGEVFTGTVVRDSDSIDQMTRTLNVEVDVDNSAGRLMPGAYAFVHLPISASAGAVTIPSDTLLFRSEGLRVGVVRDGHVKLTQITIGHDYGSTVEVVAGLAAQDPVIVNPSDSLTDGQAVQTQVLPKNAATP